MRHVKPHHRPRMGPRLGAPVALAAALLLAGACAHTQAPATDTTDTDADVSSLRDPQPLGTYSFMVPFDDDWETEWPDSAPAKRESPSDAPGATSQAPWVASGRTQTHSPTTLPATEAKTKTTRSKNDANPSAPDPLDVPKGMVVVYDDAVADEGWVDSGANRQTAPAGPSASAPASSFPSSSPAPTAGEPASASDPAPGAAHVVRRRERSEGGDTVAAIDRRTKTRQGSAKQAKAREATVSDPFAKLQRDLQAAGVQEEAPSTSRRQQPPPESLWTRSREARLPQRPGDDQRMAPGRDPGTKGIHAVAGAGVYFARDPQGGHGAHFAYGINAGWNPDFARDVVFDVGFWRASTHAGTEMVSAGTSYHHFTTRAIWQPPLPNNVFLGVGGGLMLTQSIVGYTVGGTSADTVVVLAHRPGVEATLVAGTRFRPLEVRVELRTLLRGGMRLDFLPTASLGATF